MVHVFLSSHGRLASGMQSSVEILTGGCDRLHIFDAYLDSRSVEEVLEVFYRDLPAGDTVVLLADIVGGSVCNAMLPWAQRPDTFLIGGANLAVLLELLNMDTVTADDIDELVSIGKFSVQHLQPENLSAKDNSDDFF